VSTSGTDTISSGDEPERLPRRVRGPAAPTPGARTTALTAALSLVLAGGVATAAYRTSTDAADPTTLVPASAFAVATLDLSAPGEALGGFADHFPGSPTHQGDGSAKDRLLRKLFADPDFTYDDDIKPWLGDHVAFAGWLDGGQPRLQVVMESRNDDAARKFLTGPGRDDEGAFVIRSHYVVMGDSEEIVGRSVAAAEKSALADNATYAADVAALPEDEAVVGWLDGPGAKKALSAAMSGLGASPEDMFGEMPFLAMSGSDPFEQRVALGLHVTDDYVQADMRTYGSPATTATAPSTLLTGLPSGTIGAVALAGVDTYVDTMFGFIRDFAGLAGPQQLCTGSFSGALSPDYVIPKGTPHRRMLMKARREAIKRYEKQLENQGSTGAQDFGCTTSEPVDPIEEMERTTGLSLPGDVKTLLGDRMVIAFGGMNLTGLPDIAIRSHPADVDDARPIAEKLAAALAASSDFGLFVETPDDELVVGTTSAYAKLVAGDGDLGADDAFTAAMGDVPDDITSAAFVDLTRIWPLIEAQGEDVGDAEHVHSIGMWTANDGDVQVAQLRLTAG
jgi:hypothetical protein